MNGTPPTWSTVRELVSIVVAPQHLKRTMSIAVIVGTSFFVMNQLGSGTVDHAISGCTQAIAVVHVVVRDAEMLFVKTPYL